MSKKSLILIIPALLFFFYLLSVSEQSAFTFILLLTIYFFLIKLSIKTKNNVLITGISLSAIANVIGTPLFILNKDNYSYDGWNAVKDFDFNTFSFIKVYSYSFISLFLFIIMVWFLEKATSNYGKYKIDENQIDLKTRLKLNPIIWNIILICLLLFSLFLAILMYIYKIAVLGVEHEYLPFKMVGILFYLRGYILPLILFVVYRKSSQSTIIKLSVIFIALISGALSASRGVTFFYLFPVLAGILLQQFNFKRVFFVITLILFSYFFTSLTRDVTYSSEGLSISDLPVLLLNSKSEFQSEKGIIVSLLNIISTISNRLYGAQDLVLAYQHILINPWNSFFNFTLTKTIVEDLAGDLYGLEFLPGQGYGVGMGLVGVFVMIARSNIILLVVAISYLSFLIVILNRVLTPIFKNVKTEKFSQVYYLVLFFASFNFMQATLSYIYTIISICWILGLIFLNGNLRKFINKI